MQRFTPNLSGTANIEDNGHPRLINGSQQCQTIRKTNFHDPHSNFSIHLSPCQIKCNPDWKTLILNGTDNALNGNFFHLFSDGENKNILNDTCRKISTS